MAQQTPEQLDRSFGYVMAGGSAALVVLRYVVAGRPTWWLVGLAAVFLALSLVAPRLLAPIRTVWMKFAAVLGFVNQRILLTIVFGVLITPTAVLLRALGKKPMALQADPAAGSYWRRRTPEEFTAARMERQF